MEESFRIHKLRVEHQAGQSPGGGQGPAPEANTFVIIVHMYRCSIYTLCGVLKQLMLLLQSTNKLTFTFKIFGGSCFHLIFE